MVRISFTDIGFKHKHRHSTSFSPEHESKMAHGYENIGDITAKESTCNIRALVSDSGDVIYVKKGTLAVFKFTLVDQTGEIDVVAFGKNAEGLSKDLILGQVYILKHGLIKKSDPRYCDTGHDCEIHFTSNSFLYDDDGQCVYTERKTSGSIANAQASEGTADIGVCGCASPSTCSCYAAHEDAPCAPDPRAVIYVLELEDDKYYVGKTNNIDARLRDHFDGGGSAWTKSHHPIKRVCRVTNETGSAHSIEMSETIHLMHQFGIDNVRGSQFSENILSGEKRNFANLLIRDAFNLCNNCGSEDHMFMQCPSLSSGFC